MHGTWEFRSQCLYVYFMTKTYAKIIHAFIFQTLIFIDFMHAFFLSFHVGFSSKPNMHLMCILTCFQDNTCVGIYTHKISQHVYKYPHSRVNTNQQSPYSSPYLIPKWLPSKYMFSILHTLTNLFWNTPTSRIFGQLCRPLVNFIY